MPLASRAQQEGVLERREDGTLADGLLDTPADDEDVGRDEECCDCRDVEPRKACLFSS